MLSTITSWMEKTRSRSVLSETSYTVSDHWRTFTRGKDHVCQEVRRIVLLYFSFVFVVPCARVIHQGHTLPLARDSGISVSILDSVTQVLDSNGPPNNLTANWFCPIVLLVVNTQATPRTPFKGLRRYCWTSIDTYLQILCRLPIVAGLWIFWCNPTLRHYNDVWYRRTF